ncbi:cell division protein FtsA [Patescibacteria group bacterium]
MAKDDIIVGLDVGSSIVRVIVGQHSPDEEKPHIIGVGIAPAAGIRRGVVVDVEEAVGSISTALEKAERVTGTPIESALVSIGGSHIESQLSRGVIAVSRADGEIGEDDVTRVIEAAQAITLPTNHEILHVVPKNFVVDDQEGIKDPIGMSGVRLEVEAHIIQGASSFIKNLTKCIYRAGVDIDDLVLAPLAAAEAVLTRRQKELGVVLIDIGAGTTGLTVYEEGDLLHAKVLPIGAEHITNDLAIGLRTSVDVAEKVKLEYGTALPASITTNEEVDLAKIDQNEEQVIDRKEIAEVIEARLAEIFSLVDKELKKVGKSGQLPSGVVLTGGGAKMPDIVDLAKEELRLPGQIGMPEEIPVSVDKIDDPAFATAVGLVLWGMGTEGKNSNLPLGGIQTSVNDTVGKMKKWFKTFLP